MSDRELIEAAIRASPQLAGARLQRLQLHASSLFPLYRAELDVNALAVPATLAAKVVASSQMAAAEATGLETLRRQGLACPRVFSADATKTGLRVLLMEFLATHAAGNTAQLSKDLIRLYSEPQAQYGWSNDGYIGALEQPNAWYSSFEEFWIESRILPQARRAEALKHISPELTVRLQSLVRRAVKCWRLDSIAPRLIHGDLWSGNLLAGPGGIIHLIDPAIAYANPEQDLSMLLLFGSPLNMTQMETILRTSEVSKGFRERVEFWQLYPLLVHVNLFGGAYVGQLMQAIQTVEAKL